MMTQSRAFARLYEAVRDAGGSAKLAANWLMGEVSKRLNAEARALDEGAAPIDAAALGALIRRIADGTVSNNGARQVFDRLWRSLDVASPAAHPVAPADGSAVDALIDQLGLRQVNDSGALEAIVDQVLAAHPKSVAEFKAGKDKALNALVGHAMKASQGKANPAQLTALIRARLDAA
jgi:aspartyl-tRNA(Asn)/glutamyl-tRNA(Gln) amidotransferase subunit B